MQIELVRGTRRRKYVEAVLVGDRVRVSYPSWMSKAQAQAYAEELHDRLARRVDCERIDLLARARSLARRHGLPPPRRVTWSSRQQRRWGSCTPDEGAIRVSARLAAYPPWVLDAVLVHELAHLVESGHGPEFQALIGRYPFTERARGFLAAVDLLDEGEPRAGFDDPVEAGETPDVASPAGTPVPAVGRAVHPPEPGDGALRSDGAARNGTGNHHRDTAPRAPTLFDLP